MSTTCRRDAVKRRLPGDDKQQTLTHFANRGLNSARGPTMTHPLAATDSTTALEPSAIADGPRALRDGLWASLAAVVALLPVAGLFTFDSIFYLRDLTHCFWDRHLWLRRSLLSGEWPLWDPYLAAGQSAAADALHQMFLLPVLAVRLLGTEVIGFNLWVALPFPLAGLGAYAFLRARFTPAAAALGAVVLATSGPVVSTGNFPNLSWSVAAMPWVLWAADRITGPRIGRRIGVLALVFAFQALAGEPVTMAVTAGLALALSFVVGAPGTSNSRWRQRARATLAVAGGLGLGAVVAAVQLLPMADAVQGSARPRISSKDFWSFHPLALVETVAPHLFGDFFQTPMLEDAPWLGALNSGREPFFYSVYIGSAVLTLALVGIVASTRRRWIGFWAAVSLIGLVAAFGGNTPIYPLVRTYVPALGSFRFPVKYLLVSVMALAALVAAGWEALAGHASQQTATPRSRAARHVAVLLPLAIGLGAAALWAAANAAGAATTDWFAELAVGMGVANPPYAANFLVRSIGEIMWKVALLAFGVAPLVALASSRRRGARLALATLFVVVLIDLLYAARGLNPTCPVALFAPPSWAGVVRAHPESRFYLGGKMWGRVVATDPDAPSRLVVPQILPEMVLRAVLARHTLLYPAGVGAHEMLSYDLPVLWPSVFEVVQTRFAGETREGRDRFLSRTAVRYRILPALQGGERPAMAAGSFAGSQFYDFGASNRRAFVVPEAVVVPSYDTQLEAMFGASFDDRRVVMLGREPRVAEGRVSSPVEPFARFTVDNANRVTIEAGAGPGGGFLVLLDSYAPDWEVTVDGSPATLYRANLMFRAVRLAPGGHTVEFRYRPQMILAGAAFSAVGLLGLVLISRRSGRTNRP